MWVKESEDTTSDQRISGFWKWFNWISEKYQISNSTQPATKNVIKLDIKLVQQSSKTLTPAEKTSNTYKITKEEYNKMRRNAITSTYKKAKENIKKRINEKGKEIVKKSFDNVIDRMDINAESNFL